MRKVVASVGIAGVMLVALAVIVHAQAVPLGRHCGDVGPLPLDDPDFCGCTWGEVRYLGQPVAGAVVTLTYGTEVVTDTSQLSGLEAEPYFDLTAHHLGAQRGDVVTLTAHFAGQTVSRAIRAWPEADGEQHIALIFEERGVWSPWLTGGYTRALTLAGSVVWAGGPAGVLSVSLNSSVSVVQALPWSDPAVRALAVGPAGHVWAAGAGGVAELDGSDWLTHAVPVTGAVRALAVNAAGAVWAGGGDTSGAVAVYDGGWRAAGTFPSAVTALAVDDAGRAWAGTWGHGAYRQDGVGGWDNYRAVDGLASDYVLAAVAGEGAVWFGTRPYVSVPVRGGVARYDLGAGAWRVYTQAHGLPALALGAEHIAPDWVHALAAGEDGTVWAGTGQGISALVEGDWWANYTATRGLRPGAVRAVAAGGGDGVAAPPAGVDRLDRDAVAGAPPKAEIEVLTPLTLTAGVSLTLRGSGLDGDEGGGQIVGWNWASSVDGPLCSAAECVLPHALFSPGEHALTLRVQDDEGTWSEAVTGMVIVEEGWRVWLPVVVRKTVSQMMVIVEEGWRVWLPVVVRKTVSQMLELESRDNEIAMQSDDIEAENVDLVGHIGGVSDAVFVEGDYAYVGEGSRLTILDISDTAAPVVVGKSVFLRGNIRDVYVQGNYAYVTGNGLSIVNVSAPAHPIEVGFLELAGGGGSVVVRDTIAYVISGYEDLRVVDVSDPIRPTEIGFYDAPGGARAVFVEGDIAYVTAGYEGLRLVDVSNPAQPIEVGAFDEVTGSEARTVVVDQGVAYVAYGCAGLRVVDVSDPAQPVELGVYDVPELSAEALNVVTQGSTAYVVINMGTPDYEDYL